VTSIEYVKKRMIQVECPKCKYKMPLFFEETAKCSGVIVSCKGRNCHTHFELKIKNGIQIK
jgi:hypothetical protein